MKKVIAFGTFDILHSGHIHMLKEAKAYGDYLVVIVALDNTVSEIKGRPPINNERVRMKAVKQLRIANKTRLGYLDNKYQVIAEEKPDIVALGYDQRAFIDNLENILNPHVQIVRLSPYFPEKFKSSLLR